MNGRYQAPSIVLHGAAVSATTFDLVLQNNADVDAMLPLQATLAGCTAGDGTNWYQQNNSPAGLHITLNQPGLLHGKTSIVIGWARCKGEPHGRF